MTKMKQRWIAAAGMLLAASCAAALTSVQAEGPLWIEGSSTLHPWSSTTTAVTLEFELPEKAPALDQALLTGALKGMIARVPVGTLKSEHSGLDKNMRAALKAKENPEIVYRLGSFEFTSSAADHRRARTSGELEIAGVKRPVVMDVELDSRADGLELRGRTPLKMTEYGITPPSMMLGAVKVGDAVAVSFELKLPRAAR